MEQLVYLPTAVGSFLILYYDQKMHNYFTNYHTPTCFDTIKTKNKIK